MIRTVVNFMCWQHAKMNTLNKEPLKQILGVMDLFEGSSTPKVHFRPEI